MSGWRRIRAGSGHRYVDDEGEPVDGVTRIIGEGVPKPALVDWAARETAGYALDHWETLGAMGSADRLRAMERGRFDRQKAATVRGTTVHDLAARLLHGEQVEVDDALVGHVDACLSFLEQWHVDEIAVEAMVVNREWRYAGTLDLLAYVDGNDLAGDDLGIAVVDWKTGGSGVFAETALQLAAYAHAEAYVVEGVEHELPKIGRGLAVWLRADGYDVLPLDIGPSTFRSFLYAQQVAAFRARPRGDVIGDALVAPTAEATA